MNTSYKLQAHGGGGHFSRGKLYRGNHKTYQALKSFKKYRPSYNSLLQTQRRRDATGFRFLTSLLPTRTINPTAIMKLTANMKLFTALIIVLVGLSSAASAKTRKTPEEAENAENGIHRSPLDDIMGEGCPGKGSGRPREE